MAKKSIALTEWVNVETILKEYNLTTEGFIDLIIEKQFRTRGQPFDEIDQASQFHANKSKIENNFWLEAMWEDGPPLFAYTYCEFDFQFNIRMIQVGYINIQVDKKDFEKKVDIKYNLAQKRDREPVITLKKIYNDYNQGNDNWVSPSSFLDYLQDEYDSQSGDSTKTELFAVVDYKPNYDNPRFSKLSYCINNGPIKDITRGRIYNIVSDFNRECK